MQQIQIQGVSCAMLSVMAREDPRRPPPAFGVRWPVDASLQAHGYLFQCLHSVFPLFLSLWVQISTFYKNTGHIG